jgi:membrane carboxypeptidase/penicillin-binding protein
VNSPSNNAPTVSLPRAVARRNVVLQAMLDQGVITRDALDRARNESRAARHAPQRGAHRPVKKKSASSW